MAILEVCQVSKGFPSGFLGSVRILHRVSLQVKSGQVVGFIGLNGAGKSTLINLIMNFTWPDQGHIILDGLPPADPASRRRLGYLPENPRFPEYLSADELIAFAARSAGKACSSKQAGELLDRLRLAHARTRQVRTYSKGMKQRLGLVMALLHDPEFYILDEPMSGLDPLGRQLR